MNAIQYQCGYKYQLYETYQHRLINKISTDCDIKMRFIELSPDGVLTIKQGYSWDGPSGPTLDSPCFMRGSLVHDAHYQIIREGYVGREFKDSADRELHDICINDGMSRIRAWWVLRAVQYFGRSATINNKQVIIAP